MGLAAPQQEKPLQYEARVLQLEKSPRQFSSVAQLCPNLCDPVKYSMPGLPGHHQLLELTQTCVH